MIEDTWGGGNKLMVGALVVLVLAIIGLAIYGGTVTPVQHAVEKAIPDGRFAK